MPLPPAIPTEPDSKYRYWEAIECSDANGDLNPVCLGTASTCDDGTARLQTWRILNRPDQDPRTATKIGAPRCAAPDDPQLPRADEDPVVTLKDFQRLGIISSKVSIQPRPHTLIRAHNNFYATAETQNFDITLIGKAVKVRATPGSYTWNYGDGTTRGPITEAGTPVHETHWGEETATSYAYLETGDYNVQLTTFFRGEFSVEGGPWQAIRGQAQVASEPVTLSVWRSESRNVSETCAENPEGWGC
ncbi:PKD domain-containing protein [Arthrobacter roseus]|uniref:PKD domain-containing protein n=1 Tax=Arthrobacter roseus TaxID=136274 RepID=UPI001EF8C950|nr:PKD domain-containing protein [Arthrobacter roseus]